MHDDLNDIVPKGCNLNKDKSNKRLFISPVRFCLPYLFINIPIAQLTQWQVIDNQFWETQEQLDILIEENEVLRNIQAQYESMKMQSEFQSSEKKKSSTNNQPMEDYENFQALNVSMQDEINQLRAYISQNVSSTSTEVQGFFKDQDQDLALQNQRLQLDLDKTIGERRLLSRQMENWKRQLTEAASQGEDPETYQDDDEYETEEVLKLKQEQAYRSVGALQLRVEELTLEVTKVRHQKLS